MNSAANKVISVKCQPPYLLGRQLEPVDAQVLLGVRGNMNDIAAKTAESTWDAQSYEYRLRVPVTSSVATLRHTGF